MSKSRKQPAGHGKAGADGPARKDTAPEAGTAASGVLPTLASDGPRPGLAIGGGITLVGQGGRADLSVPEPSAVTMLRMKDIVDRVVAQTGQKKRDVKPLTEAVLEVLGAALAAGDEVNLPGLGKMRISRRQAKPDGEMLTLKLRRKDGAAPSEGADDDAEE